METPVRERPPEAARADRSGPSLWSSVGWSATAHVLVVAVAIVAAWFAPAPTLFEPPPGPVVDLITPRGDSKVFKVGPLAAPSGKRGSSSKPAPKTPKAEPKPVTKPAPDAIAEPKKPEPKPEPKPEVKKPEPKPEPKPEVKKPEPEPTQEPAGKEPEKPEPTKPAASEPDSTDPKSQLGSKDAGSSKEGVAAQGAGSTKDAGSSGDPNGGGGGAGTRGPEFYAYFAYMYQSIKGEWVWAGEQDATLATTVRFSILADGTIADARVTERSRSPMYDESALNAVRATGGLTPPPPSVRADFEDVELVFRAGDLMQP